MHRRNSRRAGERRLLRKPRPLLLVTAVLALLVSTGCRTVPASDGTAKEILISQVPEMPQFPVWPDVKWSYSDGWYSLDEKDVDKVLDYLENGVPVFRFELEQYEEQLWIVLKGIMAL